MAPKKVAVLVADMYEDNELWYPFFRMREAGLEPVLIGIEKTSFKGKHGLPAKADLSIDEARPDDFCGVFIPGGYAPDMLRRSPKVLDFVRRMHDAGRTVAAICHAPWVLASAGLCKGRRMTSYFAVKDDIVNAGAQWEDSELVVDRNIITSRSPQDLPVFGKAVAEAMLGQQQGMKRAS